MWSMTPEVDLRSAAIQRMWEGGVVMNLVVNHLWLIPSACIDMWCKQCDGPVLRLDKFNASGQKEVIEAVSKPHNTQVWCLNCNDGVFSREKQSETWNKCSRFCCVTSILHVRYDTLLWCHSYWLPGDKPKPHGCSSVRSQLYWFASICTGDHAAHLGGQRMQTNPLTPHARETKPMTFLQCAYFCSLCIYVIIIL